MKPSPRPAIFVDRDGTIMEEVDYCRDPALARGPPGAREALASLRAAGYAIVIITNQSGIGRGRITLSEYHSVHARLLELLGPDLIDGTYFCPDAPGAPSTRRKPAPGMLLEATADLNLDLPASWMIGDKAADVRCGKNAGARSILVRTGYGHSEASEGAELVADDLAEAARHILRR